MAIKALLERPNELLHLCDADKKNIQRIETWINDLGRGFGLMLKEEFDEALEYLQRVKAHADMCPSPMCLSGNARLLIAFLELERGEYTQALRHCKDMIERDSEEIIAYYYWLCAFFFLVMEAEDRSEKLKTAKTHFSTLKRLIHQLPDGKLYPTRNFRKLVDLQPEVVQERLERLKKGVLINRFYHPDSEQTPLPDEDTDHPVDTCFYMDPDVLLKHAETMMGGIEAMAIVVMDPGAALAAVLESDESVVYRASLRIFLALAEIDAAAEIETDTRRKNQRISTAELWLEELDENLPEEIVELKEAAREALDLAKLDLAKEEL